MYFSTSLFAFASSNSEVIISLPTKVSSLLLLCPLFFSSCLPLLLRFSPLLFPFALILHFKTEFYLLTLFITYSNFFSISLRFFSIPTRPLRFFFAFAGRNNLMCHPSGILFNPCTLSKAESSETIAPSTAKAEAAIRLSK
jgi:hypothetical protein